MNLFKIFTREKPTKTIQRASATLYPEKIIISTENVVKEGFSISTTNISVISPEISNELLGSKIRHHLSLTLLNQPIPKDYNAHYQSFLKATGLKTAKEEYNNAKYLSIRRQNSQLIITPTANGGATGKNRGFLSFENNDIVLDFNLSDAELGIYTRNGWNLCR